MKMRIDAYKKTENRVRTSNTHLGRKKIYFFLLFPFTLSYICVMARFPLDVQPEFDTVRIYWPCHALVNLDRIFEDRAEKAVLSYLRVKIGEESKLLPAWGKFRLDQKKSWWGTMLITREKLQISKTTFEDCMCFEFSVAKWYNVTNAVNRGHRDFREVESAIFEVLADLDIQNFCSSPIKLDVIHQHFKDTCLLRRCDLSYNFKVDSSIATRDYIRFLSTCRMNGNATALHADQEEDEDPSGKVEGKYQTVSWGGGRGSHYKIMFYDKEAEQKHYKQQYLPGETWDIRTSKKIFFEKHSEKWKNVVRFEVQFRSKFFMAQVSNYRTERGEKMAEKIINLCVDKWHNLLEKIDEQTQSENQNSAGGVECDVPQLVAEKLKSLRDAGEISRTVCGNMIMFLEDCNCKGWQNYRDEIGKDLFSRNYRKLLKLTNYDVKRMTQERITGVSRKLRYGLANAREHTQVVFAHAKFLAQIPNDSLSYEVA